MQETLEAPIVTQLFVPGRGTEVGADNPFAGFLLDDSPASQASYERGVATGEYTKLHKAIGRVVFSGAVSFMVPERDRPLLTEADGMDCVAQSVDPNIGASIQSFRDRKSLTSFGNLVESVRAGYLDPNQVTGVVIHKDHEKRFLKAARLVMPNTTFVTIHADKTDSTESKKPSRNDQIADALYSVAMLAVKQGDIDTIARRDELVQKSVLKVAHGLRKVVKSFLGSDDSGKNQIAQAT